MADGQGGPTRQIAFKVQVKANGPYIVVGGVPQRQSA